LNIGKTVFRPISAPKEALFATRLFDQPFHFGLRRPTFSSERDFVVTRAPHVASVRGPLARIGRGYDRQLTPFGAAKRSAFYAQALRRPLVEKGTKAGIIERSPTPLALGPETRDRPIGSCAWHRINTRHLTRNSRPPASQRPPSAYGNYSEELSYTIRGTRCKKGSCPLDTPPIPCRASQPASQP
jgi:hypothetical protein